MDDHERQEEEKGELEQLKGVILLTVKDLLLIQ